MEQKKDWLNVFVEKNSWAIIMLVVRIVFFFGSYLSNNNSLTKIDEKYSLGRDE